MRPHLSELRRDADVLVIGPGWPAAAQGFRERSGLEADVPIVCDQTMRSYDLAGMKRSLWRLFHPAAAWAFVRALLRGHRQRLVSQGDVTQQAGMLLLAADGRVGLRHADAHVGDHPRMSDVLDAVRRLAASSSPAAAGAPIPT